MRDESSTLPQSSTRRLSRSTFSAFDETSDSARISRFIIVLFAANVISAVLFIGLVNRPAYDDPYNIFDVHNYATRGLSVGTLLSQRNPPGPTSFLWMAAGVRFLGGDELRDARIANLMSWLLLGAGVLIGAKYSSSPQLWYGALLVLLVFPHTLEATATILTEGPALLFAVAGILAWIEFASRPSITPRLFALGMLGGILMGLAVTCRQYYLALLPGNTCNPPGPGLERHLKSRNGHGHLIQPRVEGHGRPEFVSAHCCCLLCFGLSPAVHISRDVPVKGFPAPNRAVGCGSGRNRRHLFQFFVSAAGAAEFADSNGLASALRGDSTLCGNRDWSDLQCRVCVLPTLGPARFPFFPRTSRFRNIRGRLLHRGAIWSGRQLALL